MVILAVSLEAPSDLIEEVMIFGVSRGVATDPLQEVVNFGVSQGVPTDLGSAHFSCQTYLLDV